jgi:hypothetical protein
MVFQENKQKNLNRESLGCGVFSEFKHRNGLTTECIVCGEVSKQENWLIEITDTCNTGEIDYCGNDKIRVSSKCPKCGESSWAHFSQETLNISKIKNKSLEETYDEKREWRLKLLNTQNIYK